MVEELARFAGEMRPALPTAALILVSVVGGMAAMRIADADRIRAAKAMEDKADSLERLRAALFEPTAEQPNEGAIKALQYRAVRALARALPHGFDDMPRSPLSVPVAKPERAGAL